MDRQPLFCPRQLVAVWAITAMAVLGACGGGGDDERAQCSDFRYQEDAQAALRGGQSQLDGDRDGTACESLPRRPTTPTTSTAPAVITQGVYSGSITGGPSTQFQLLALENGGKWAMYGNMSGSTFLVRGFVQADGTQSGTEFSSTAARDYGVNPAAVGTISGTITQTSVSGVATFAGVSRSFTGAPIVNATYDYNSAPSLQQVVGNWNLTGLDGTTATVAISGSGGFTGNNAGCSISGAVRPRPSGKNVFDVTVTTGPAPCQSPGTVLTGVGITYLVQGSSTRQLVVAVQNTGRTLGYGFSGTR
jgi:hypothetical protein